jgi:biotin operon repressor
MELEKKIIEAMKKSGKPMSAGQLTEAVGAERKEIDKAMKNLKTSGEIVSPKNCFWEPKKN